jgi:hypothetical protein
MHGKFSVAANAAVSATATLASCRRVVLLGVTVLAVTGLGVAANGTAHAQQAAPVTVGNGQFSAFAINNQGRTGAALFQETVNAAQSGALTNCGGKDAGCKIFYTAPASRCTALAEGLQRRRFHTSSFRYGASFGSSQQQVADEALRACQRRALAGSCKIVVAQCR